MMKVLKHLKVVIIHRWYVFLNCCYAGIPLRGLLHDMSKFSPTEFWESVRYYQGNRSPIDACKEVNGYSKAWLHHKGRNSHHYEYWQDNFDKGGKALQMPFEDALEMICDYLAAGKAYSKKNFTYAGEYEWWKNKRKNPLAMHPQTKMFVESMMSRMAQENSKRCIKYDTAKKIYEKAEDKSKKGIGWL